MNSKAYICLHKGYFYIAAISGAKAWSELNFLMCLESQYISTEPPRKLIEEEFWCYYTECFLKCLVIGFFKNPALVFILKNGMRSIWVGEFEVKWHKKKSKMKWPKVNFPNTGHIKITPRRWYHTLIFEQKKYCF